MLPSVLAYFGLFIFQQKPRAYLSFLFPVSFLPLRCSWLPNPLFSIELICSPGFWFRVFQCPVLVCFFASLLLFSNHYMFSRGSPTLCRHVAWDCAQFSSKINARQAFRWTKASAYFRQSQSFPIELNSKFLRPRGWSALPFYVRHLLEIQVLDM